MTAASYYRPLIGLLYNKKVRKVNYMETVSKTINGAKVYNILRQVIPIFYNSICEKVLSNVVLLYDTTV